MTEKNDFADALKQMFNDPRLGAQFLTIVADVKDFGKALSERMKSPEMQEQLDKMKSSLGLDDKPDGCHGCNSKGWFLIGEKENQKVTICPICNGTGKKS